MTGKRRLIVMADDFGFGPAVSQGILDLAQRGIVTGTVLMVNSPFAEAAVASWRRAGRPVEMGWHPTLTSDSPVLPPGEVPGLVGQDGNFLPLGRLVKRLFLGRVPAAQIEAELRAQYRRFCDLVGGPPAVVNTHQHIGLFQPVGFILLQLLARQRPLPFVRCVREPWRMLWSVPGARIKRAFLSFLGKPLARKQQAVGFPGNDWLAGITDPRWVHDPRFFTRWLSKIPGQVVELMCHPGQRDTSLIGRDGTATDGSLERRVRELELLGQPSFREACTAAGFECVAAGTLSHTAGATAHAA